MGLLDGGDTVQSIACDDLDMDMVVMHTFEDVDGVVDMHPPSKHPSLFLACLPPSLPSLSFLITSIRLHADRQVESNSNISVDRYIPNLE